MSGSKTRCFTIGIAVLVLLPGCGSSDTQPKTSTNTTPPASTGIDRTKIAESIAATAKTNGSDAELSCVKDIVASFSEADAVLMQTGLDNPAAAPRLSVEGEAKLADFVKCATSFGNVTVPSVAAGTANATEAILMNLVVTNLEGQGLKADKACITELMKGLTAEQLQDPSSPEVAKFAEQATTCIQK